MLSDSDKKTAKIELAQALRAEKTFPTWRCFAKTGAVFATIASFILLHGCKSDQQRQAQNDDMETVEIVDTISVEEPTKGLITTVKEVKPQQFAIQKEEVVDNKDSSRVIVQYLDGRTERLTLAQAKSLIAPQDSAAAQDTALHVQLSPQDSAAIIAAGDSTKTTPTTIIINNTEQAAPSYHSSYSPSLHTLGYVLMGGALGYYMGKSMATPPNPNVYQYPQQTYYNNRRYSSSPSYRSSTAAPYSALRTTAKKSTVRRTTYESVPRSVARDMKSNPKPGRSVTTAYSKPSQSRYSNSSKSNSYSSSGNKSSGYSSSGSGSYGGSTKSYNSGSNYSSTYKSTPSNSKSGYFGGSSSKSSSYSSGGSSYSSGRSSYSGGSSYSS